MLLCRYVNCISYTTTTPFLTVTTDDSALNCTAAKKLGWSVAQLVEGSGKYIQPADPKTPIRISNLKELKDVFPQFFKSA